MKFLKSIVSGAFAVSAICMFSGCSATVKDAGCSVTVKDADGNEYKAEKIGNQVWMTEDLRTTKFNDGTSIPKITDGAAWPKLSTPGYSYYKNSANADSIIKYGALYNWYAVENNALAPKGWHVPTDDDWNILQNYLIGHGYNWDGSKSENKIAKALASRIEWKISTNAGAIGNDLTKNNKSGFSALPGGSRRIDGSFSSRNFSGYWWSATQSDTTKAWYRYLFFDFDNFFSANDDKSCGFSVRLVRD